MDKQSSQETPIGQALRCASCFIQWGRPQRLAKDKLLGSLFKALILTLTRHSDIFFLWTLVLGQVLLFTTLVLGRACQGSFDRRQSRGTDAFTIVWHVVDGRCFLKRTWKAGESGLE